MSFWDFSRFFVFLKRAGLKSSGWIASSYNWKTKRIACFFLHKKERKKIKKKVNYWFLDFLKIFFYFYVFFIFFLDFLKMFQIFLIFWIFEFFEFLFFFWFKGFLSKLLRLLIKVTKVNTGHQKLPQMRQNRIISSFCCPKSKKSLGRSHPQELEAVSSSWKKDGNCPSIQRKKVNWLSIRRKSQLTSRDYSPNLCLSQKRKGGE